jgi:hypothetical protein
MSKHVDPELKALRAWEERTYPAAGDPTTLGHTAAASRRYLENRLRSAFQEGVKVGRELRDEELQIKLASLLDLKLTKKG